MKQDGAVMTKSLLVDYMKLSMFLVSVILFASAEVAFGKAYYAPKNEMISKSDAIAIVEVYDVKPEGFKGKHWEYKQAAYVMVERTLKGNVSGQIKVFGEENFICERCMFSKGRFLAFLRQDGERWACSNWYLSLRPIKDGKVDWYSSDTGTSLKSIQLEDAINDVESKIKAKAK